MKNLKRALSLVLSAAMMVGMMAMGTAAASFKDVDAKDNLEAIEVLKAVGVMEGDDAGNFNPDALVTRNEMAVVMTNLLGLKAGGSHPFTDVPAWASDYVAACYNNGTVAGTSATTFGGSQTVTAAQAALMVMKALGYFGFQGEFGEDWQLATIKMATKIDLFAGMNVYPTEALTRNEVAKLILNALESTVMVVTQHGGMTVEGNGITVNQQPTYDYSTPAANNSGLDYGDGVTAEMELVEKLFGNDLRKNADTTDAFGRPANEWTYGTKSIKTAKAPALTYTTAVKGKTIYADLGKPSTFSIEDTSSNSNKIVVDGLANVALPNDGGSPALSFGMKDVSGSIDDDVKVGGEGSVTEVYFNKNSGEINIVVINTYLAQATADYNAKSENLNITVHATGTFPTTLKAADFAVADYEDEDYILVTAVTADGTNYTIKSIAPATKVENVKVSAYKADSYVTADGVKYEYNTVAKNDAAAQGDTLIDGAYTLQSTAYNLILDNYGYVIGAEGYASDADLSDYLFVTDFALAGFDYNAKVVFADGTKKTVVVAKAAKIGNSLVNVSGEASPNTAISTNGQVAEGRFYTFDVNKDGNYELTEVASSYNPSAAIDSGKAQIVNGQSTKGNTATVVIADGKVTTGIKNAPDVTAAPVWWLNDANGNTLWVFSKTAGSVTTDADEIVYIYGVAAGEYAVAKDADENPYYIYNAIKNGEKTTINVDATVANRGLYAIGAYDDGYVDATYLTRIDNGAPSAAYVKEGSVATITHKNGTVTVNSNSYVLADDAVIYTIDTTDDYAVKTISASYIKNLAADINGNDVVYLIQESTTDTDIVAMYILIG